MPKKLSNSAKIRLFKLDKNKIILELNELIASWKKKCDLKLVILFGSLAKGDFSIKSDSDVLIVANNIPPDYSSRFDLFYSPNISTALHLVIFSTNEIFEQIDKLNTFLFEIFHNFKLLYGDTNLLNIILSKINEKIAKRQIIRHNFGWEIIN